MIFSCLERIISGKNGTLQPHSFGVNSENALKMREANLLCVGNPLLFVPLVATQFTQSLACLPGYQVLNRGSACFLCSTSNWAFWAVCISLAEIANRILLLLWYIMADNEEDELNQHKKARITPLLWNEGSAPIDDAVDEKGKSHIHPSCLCGPRRTQQCMQEVWMQLCPSSWKLRLLSFSCITFSAKGWCPWRLTFGKTVHAQKIFQ